MSRESYRHNMLLGPGQSKPQRYGVNGAPKKASSASQDDDARLDFSEIWLTLKRGKWVILLTCLVVTLAVATYTYLTPAEYEASAMTLVEPRDDGNNSGGSILAIRTGAARGIANEVARLEYSSDMYRRVADRLLAMLEEDELDNPTVQYPILFDEEDQLRPTDEIVYDLRSRMKFEGMREEDMIRITAASSTPEEASMLANSFAEAYQNFSRESSRSSAAAAREYLEEQVERRREELAEMDDQLVNYSRQRDFPTRGEAGERLIAEYGQLRAQRESVRGEIDRQRYQLQALQQELQSVEPELGSRAASNINIQNLESQIQTYSNRIAETEIALEEYYMNNPEIRGNEEDYEETRTLKRRLDQYREKQQELVNQLARATSETEGQGGGLTQGNQVSYVGQLRADIFQTETTIQGQEAQLENLNRRLAELESELDGVPRQRVELEQLERQRRILEQDYVSFLQEYRQAVIAEESELGYVDIVNEASVPMFPVRPNMRQNIILGVLLGLGLGIGMAFVRRAANTRLETPEDLQEHGFVVTGVVPSMRQEIKQSFAGKETVEVDGNHLSTSLITLLNPWSPIAENYRLIRTNIQSSTGEVPETMLVTSPEMGDGKTVTSTNLAIALARNGVRTLLVDADLRRPNAHRLLGRPLGPGLGEYLREEEQPSIEDFRTGIDDLYFVPAGKADMPPAEILSSRRMLEFLDEMRAEFDTILIDSPPVLAVPDAVVLSRHCAATFVVVRANRSELRALETVRSTLEAVDVPIAGTILNNFNPDKSGYAYGYGYGYGYTREYVYA